MIKFMKDRMGEGSSHVALASLIQTFYAWSTGQLPTPVAAGAAVTAVLGILLPDSGSNGTPLKK